MNHAIITLLVENYNLSEQRKVIQQLYRDEKEFGNSQIEEDILLENIKMLNLKVMEIDNAIELIYKSYDNK